MDDVIKMNEASKEGGICKGRAVRLQARARRVEAADGGTGAGVKANGGAEDVFILSWKADERAVDEHTMISHRAHEKIDAETAIDDKYNNPNDHDVRQGARRLQESGHDNAHSCGRGQDSV